MSRENDVTRMQDELRATGETAAERDSPMDGGLGV